MRRERNQQQKKGIHSPGYHTMTILGTTILILMMIIMMSLIKFMPKATTMEETRQYSHYTIIIVDIKHVRYNVLDIIRQVILGMFGPHHQLLKLLNHPEVLLQ